MLVITCFADPFSVIVMFENACICYENFKCDSFFEFLPVACSIKLNACMQLKIKCHVFVAVKIYGPYG